MNIFEKLKTIQTRLKAPKSQYNSFGDYYYRKCEDILEAVKPILAEVGAVITLTDEVVLIGDRFYIKATATLYDMAEDYRDSFTIRSTAYAREEETRQKMTVAQITGAASSYARKYALNGLLAIDDTKDDDATTDAPAEKPTAKPALDPALLADAESLHIDLGKVATYLKKPVENLTNDELRACIEQKRKALGGAK